METPNQILLDFLDSYNRKWGDWPEGDTITPHTIVSGYFNQDAEIDKFGDVSFGDGRWASAEQLVELVNYLREQGNV